jgi:predicted nucleotidyltransferase
VNLNSTAVRKILPLLALRPGEWFTLSSICAYADLDTKSASRVLGQFRAEGFLADHPAGLKAYGANTAYAMYPEMKVIALRLLDVPAAMRKAGAKMDLVMAFGSLLRPTFGAQSDIDLLVVTAQGDAARRGVGEVETRLGKHFSPKVMDPARFSAALANGDPFIQEIMERPHAVLTGSLDRFGDAV